MVMLFGNRYIKYQKQHIKSAFTYEKSTGRDFRAFLLDQMDFGSSGFPPLPTSTSVMGLSTSSQAASAAAGQHSAEPADTCSILTHLQPSFTAACVFSIQLFLPPPQGHSLVSASTEQCFNAILVYYYLQENTIHFKGWTYLAVKLPNNTPSPTSKRHIEQNWYQLPCFFGTL